MSIFNDNSSSSDDDDVMLEALREATDSHFLKESLFRNKDETGNSNNNIKDEKTYLPKSLRRNIEFIEQSNEFGVTQDFKNFVAKQLAKSLDKCVKEVDHENDSESNKKKKKRKKKNRDNMSMGIKLMSDSKVNLIDIVESSKEENIEHNKRRRKELNTGDDSVESISKCREVAVQPDWILSKSSTAVWTDKQKGTVYRYKKSKDGSLIERN